nr:hypothetical protein [Tanacetum cinerariifolium]
MYLLVVFSVPPRCLVFDSYWLNCSFLLVSCHSYWYVTADTYGSCFTMVPAGLLYAFFFCNSKFYMYPRFIQLIIQNQVGATCFIYPALTQKVFANMRRVEKVDDDVAAAVEENVYEDVAHDAIPSPLPHAIPSSFQEPSSPPQQPQSSPQAPPQDAEVRPQLQQVLNVCSALTKRVENLEKDNAAQKLVIIKLKARVKRLEKANMVKSSKLRRLRKVGASRQVESSDDIEDVFNQGRMIDDMDKDEGIELVKDAEEDDSEVQEVVEVVTTAKLIAEAQKQAEIYHLDLDHPSEVLSMQEDDLEVQEVVKVVTTVNLITEVVTAATSQVSAASETISAAKRSISAAQTVVAAYTRRRKGVIIRDLEEELSSKTPAKTPKLKDKGKGILIEIPKPMKKNDQIELDAEYARKLHEEINKDHEEINKDIDWDAAINHVKQKSMGNQYIKRYHGMKKRPQTESEARKNMMTYLKSTDGYQLDFFKGMSYDEIRPIFQAKFDANMRFLLKSREEMEEEDRQVLKSINETPAQKATKRRKLNEKAQEVEDLKKNLEVVNDEDDDVFTKATPLGRKVKENQEKDKIGSKPDKNEMRGGWANERMTRQMVL